MSTPDEAAAEPFPPPLQDGIQAAAPAPKTPDPGLAERLADPPITAAGLARATRQLDGFLAALLFVLAFALASFAIRNSDFWMHLATGRALVNGTYDVFAGNDPFSFTTAGVRWVNHAWLFDWAVYGLYGLLGGPGLVVLKGLVVVALAGVLFQIRRPGQTLWAPLFGVGLALLVLSPRLLFQPTIVSLLFLGITLAVLVKASARWLWALPPLFALWANLDNWFLLGPLTVVLFLLGDWLQQFLRRSGTFESNRRKRLALVLVVGLAACLLNPNGVAVFSLPPELAYLVVEVTGPLPSDYVAAGNTLHELAKVDPNFLSYVSPLAWDYLSRPTSGLNVAGLSYFVLLGLGVLSFVLAAVAKSRPEATELPAGFGPRLAIWFVFAVLSLILVRLIPFFAVVAGPILALNCQDFARGYLGAQIRIEGKWRLWSLGGRLATAAGFLGALFLAWPGWLHGSPDDADPTHRIAWSVEEDPSLRQAAERIGELQQKGKLRHGFNYSLDIANYLSWFCPGAKSFCDHRFALFAGCAAQYMRARQSLREEGEFFIKLRFGQRPKPPRRDWQQVFQDQGVNYLVLTGLNKNTNVLTSELALTWWLSGASWAPLYADGRTIVLGWIEPGPRDRFAGLEVDLSRLAFGPVPEDRRAPLAGPEAPREPPGFWLDYWVGPPPVPLAEASALQCFRLYQIAAQRWYLPYLSAWQLARWHEAVASSAAIPGSVSGPAAAAASTTLPRGLLQQRFQQLGGRPFLKPADIGPPAAAVLAVRNARRAVAESPIDANSQLILAEAVQTLWKGQELFWAPRQTSGPQAFAEINFLDRQTLRLLQYLAALNHFLSLKGDQPNLVVVKVHKSLALTYLGMHYLDLGLEHLGRARELLADVPPPSDEAEKAEIPRMREELDRIYKEVNTDVKKRNDYYQLHTAAGDADFRERFKIALVAPYRITDENNQASEDRRGLGLARLALDQLRQKTNVAKLSDQDKADFVRLQVKLLLTMGRVHEVREGWSPNLKGLLGGDYESFEVALGAASGDYGRADRALVVLEEMTAKANRQHHIQWRKVLEQRRLEVLGALALDSPFQVALGGRAGMQVLQQQIARQPRLEPVPDLSPHLRSLRGLLALEQGDTGKAAKSFGDALRTVGPAFFPDRPIAARYARLLRNP